MTVADILRTPIGHNFAGLAFLFCFICAVMVLVLFIERLRLDGELEVSDVHAQAMKQYGHGTEYVVMTRRGVFFELCGLSVWKVVEARQVII